MYEHLDRQQKESLVKYLKEFITTERLQRFEEVLEARTRHITVVLEDIYQPHNASAVLRSCDCFGVQDVHIIENKNTYTVNPQVAMGASKWLSIYKYNLKSCNTVTCLDTLKDKGYKIAAMSPSNDAMSIFDFDVSEKFALLFGTEMHGLSKQAVDNADAFVKIPMYGFTESFNISVTVALSLFHFTNQLRGLKKNVYRLTEEDKTDVYLGWLSNSLKNSSILINNFIKEKTA